MTLSEPNPHPHRTFEPPRMVAVIDIGASSLRMQIAEIKADSGEIRKLESYSQAVSIGRDSFNKGFIDRNTIEDCVRVMQLYRDKLNEYDITKPTDIRVIATSGVREAANRLAFTDRIFVAAGFEIEPFDEAELHRVTYLGILPFLEQVATARAGNTLVLEVGGGSTELLYVNRLDVLFSRTFRLGSLRLRKTLERYDAPLHKTRELMEIQILQTFEEFKSSARLEDPETFIAMGSDVRFAANEINQKPVTDKLVELKLKQLESFTDEILRQSPP